MSIRLPQLQRRGEEIVRFKTKKNVFGDNFPAGSD
jgi:hypothetical protein